MARGAYHFVSWCRSGIGALLDGAAGTASLALGDAGSASVALTGYTPADVIGLDARAIIRMVPPPGACDHEPNIFPAVELEHPGLPWLVSARGDAERAMPWLVLVVVRDQPGVQLSTMPATQQRVLSIDPPARVADELPDLAQSWAWAHAQTAGDAFDAGPLARSIGESRARLIAPRVMSPRTAYFACIVPAFAAGVAAVFGNDVADPNAPAWIGDERSLLLPVFHAWRFTTGDGGDFASLARAIGASSLAREVGGRVVDISAPGWAAPNLDGARVEIAGALRSPKYQEPPLSPAAAAIGDAVIAAIGAGGTTYPPPAYGTAAARTEQLASSPPWLRALNRNLGQRIGAGIGAAVVRMHQDMFVEAAWREVGDAEAANTLIRRCELAAELTERLAHRHLRALPSDGELLSIARPLLSRMRVTATPGATTVAAAIRTSALPSATLSASLRRVARAPSVARATRASTGATLEAIDAGRIVPAPPKQLASGAAAFDHVETLPDRPRLGVLTPATIDAAATHWRERRPRRPPVEPPIGRPPIGRPPRVPGAPPVLESLLTMEPPSTLARAMIPEGERPHRPPPIDDDSVLDRRTIDEFAAAARRHQAYVLAKLTPPKPIRPRFGSETVRPFGAIRAAIESQWTAEAGILPLLASRIDGAPGRSRFQPIRIEPVLDRPLLPLVHQLSPDHVMPGIGGLLRDRAALAVSGSDFVRAVLVGANEELGRELLWRGFPSALGHTWLRSFWGRTVLDPRGARVGVPDIPPIEAWPADGPPAQPAQLVLLIRAELFARYPNAIVYATPARWIGTRRTIAPVEPTLPIMSARLGGDLVLFGFDLAESTVRGTGSDPGWYFVIAEHPSEPRFGLAARSFGPPSRWRDLAWSDLAAEDVRGGYLRTDGPLAQRSFAGPPAAAWGRDAASQAAITLRVPARVAFHATTLLP